MSIINHKLLTQRALPVASQAMSAWVISRSLMEEDFASEEDSTEASVTTLPPISVLAVITVEPITGRVMGSRWQVAGELDSIITFKANKIFSNVENASVSFHIKLPKLLLFEFQFTGLHRNFSNWMPWEKVFSNGNIILRNMKGDVYAQDKEAIIAICPQSPSGMLFRLVVAPKSVGNMVLAVNVIPGSVA